MERPLLEVEDLHVSFLTAAGPVRAVRGVSFRVAAGETVALIGESGCGKTATGLAILRLLPPSGRILGGAIRLEGRDLLGLGERELRSVRGRSVAMVFQDPQSSLNPVLTVGQQLVESLARHRGLRGAAARVRARELLERVGIAAPEERLRQYPHQLSGGMRQRVMIAMALAGGPRLLIADEPTTALDVTVQAQILDLLRDLRREYGLATLLITHDLRVVAGLAERVVVMYAGRVAEEGPVERIFGAPAHPYTWSLLQAARRRGEGAVLAGQPPDLRHPPGGCPFHPRCPCVLTVCREEPPPAVAAGPAGHTAACWLAAGGPSGRPGPGLRGPAPGEHPARRAEPVSGQPAAAAEAGPVAEPEVLLRVEGLKKHFALGRRLLRALDGVDLELRTGEVLAVVGESGCGKSTLWRTALHLQPPTAGRVVFRGRPVSPRDVRGLRAFRRQVGVVFQDPYASLNPRLQVEEIVAEPLEVAGWPRRERRERVRDLLGLVGLRPEHAAARPGELSGGQRQRVAIARALAASPSLLVADEPVSSLDVTIQAQVVGLLRELRERLGLAYLFITHDLGLVPALADRVAVMYLGRVVEVAPVQELYRHPAHPYAEALLAAMPDLDGRQPRAALRGEVPSPLDPPPGCPFHPRCPRPRPECREERPPLRDVGGHLVACHRA